eukprot:g120.t1
MNPTASSLHHEVHGDIHKTKKTNDKSRSKLEQKKTFHAKKVHNGFISSRKKSSFMAPTANSARHRSSIHHHGKDDERASTKGHEDQRGTLKSSRMPSSMHRAKHGKVTVKKKKDAVIKNENPIEPKTGINEAHDQETDTAIDLHEGKKEHNIHKEENNHANEVSTTTNVENDLSMTVESSLNDGEGREDVGATDTVICDQKLELGGTHDDDISMLRKVIKEQKAIIVANSNSLLQEKQLNSSLEAQLKTLKARHGESSKISQESSLQERHLEMIKRHKKLETEKRQEVARLSLKLQGIIALTAENKKQWSNDLEVAQTAHRKLLEKHKALREQYEKMQESHSESSSSSSFAISEEEWKQTQEHAEVMKTKISLLERTNSDQAKTILQQEQLLFERDKKLFAQSKVLDQLRKQVDEGKINGAKQELFAKRAVDKMHSRFYERRTAHLLRSAFASWLIVHIRSKVVKLNKSLRAKRYEKSGRKSREKTMDKKKHKDSPSSSPSPSIEMDFQQFKMAADAKLRKAINAAKSMKTLATQWEAKAHAAERRVFFLQKKVELVQRHASASQEKSKDDLVSQHRAFRRQSVRLQDFQSALNKSATRSRKADEILQEKNARILELEKKIENLTTETQSRLDSIKE